MSLLEPMAALGQALEASFGMVWTALLLSAVDDTSQQQHHLRLDEYPMQYLQFECHDF
jgi:hypothetical protein